MQTMKGRWFASVSLTKLSLVATGMFLAATSSAVAQPVITIQSNIVGQAGTTSYTDTTATNVGPYSYRVGVGN
jgi:hypothetical protein